MLRHLPRSSSFSSASAQQAPSARADDNASIVANRLLQRRCLILLGDSSMTETAHDLAILLHGLRSGPSLDEYLKRAMRMPSHATRRLDSNHSLLEVAGDLGVASLTFEGVTGGNQRKMWFTSPFADTVVLHRFIGHYEVSGNFAGIRSINALRVRQELSALAHDLCGDRPRTLWLQSGYHDVYAIEGWSPSNRNPRNASNTTSTSTSPTSSGGEDATSAAVPRPQLSAHYKQYFERALEWAESLASHRLWLSRHNSFVDSPLLERSLSVQALEDWVREEALLHRKGWRYVDHREAWQCSRFSTPAAERGLPIHTGAIQRGYWDPSYKDFYLAGLRTWLAITATAHG